MIRYSVVCGRGHAFEGWFRDSATFDAQAASHALTCPFCDSTDIQKGVMAPHVARGARPSAQDEAPPAPADSDRALRETIRGLRETVLAATEDVGERFPAEAREMHDGDAPRRAIRGKASLAEAKALLDDGVAVLPLPGEGH